MSFLSHLERKNIKHAINKAKETVAYECHCIRQQNIKPVTFTLKKSTISSKTIKGVVHF